MGLLSFFAPAELPYPGATGGASAPVQGAQEGAAAPQPGQGSSVVGFLGKTFAPAELAYPQPAKVTTDGDKPLVPELVKRAGEVVTPPTAPAAGATDDKAGAAQSPAVSPVTVVIAPWPSQPEKDPAAQPSAPASPPTVCAPAPPAAPTAAPPAAPPVAAEPVAKCPVDERLVVYATNPRLRARPPKAQDVYLEEVLDEKVTVKMLRKDGEPIVFAVPDGANAVELSIGPIEANPGHGFPDDLDAVITAGELKVDGVGAAGHTTGGEVRVTVPWRYASFIEMAEHHLRIPIFARFYVKE